MPIARLPVMETMGSQRQPRNAFFPLTSFIYKNPRHSDSYDTLRGLFRSLCIRDFNSVPELFITELNLPPKHYSFLGTE